MKNQRNNYIQETSPVKKDEVLDSFEDFDDDEVDLLDTDEGIVNQGQQNISQKQLQSTQARLVDYHQNGNEMPQVAQQKQSPSSMNHKGQSRRMSPGQNSMVQSFSQDFGPLNLQRVEGSGPSHRNQKNKASQSFSFAQHQKRSVPDGGMNGSSLYRSPTSDHQEQSQKDFQREYQRLMQKIQGGQSSSNSFLMTQSARVQSGFPNSTFDNHRNSQQSRERLEVFQQRTLDKLEKKQQKIQILKEEMEKKDISECSFAPKLRSKSANKTQRIRDLQAFLQDQAKKEEDKQMKINSIKQLEQQKLEAENIWHPKINDRSKKLLEKKNSVSGDVYNRLYDQGHKLKAQAQLNDRQNQQQSNENIITFRPAIQKKSQQLKRDKDHLYEDASKRKIKRELAIQENQDQMEKSTSKMTSKMLSQNTEKYFIAKFTKEIINIFSSLELDQVSSTNETLSLDVMKQFLLRIGFLSESQLAVESSQERALLSDMWRLLGGHDRGHVTLNNLRIFLLAIMGTYVAPGLKKEEQALQQVVEGGVGLFNEHGDLFLENYEVPKIKKTFQLFQSNRIQFESRQRESRKRDASLKSEYNFKPKVNDNSIDIAQKYRQKLEKECQSKLNPLDWLQQPSKNHQWQETAQKILQQEELKECTFRPEIKDYQKLTRGKSQDILSKFNVRKESSSSRIRSKELMPNTGNKFNDLYEVSKQMSQLKRRVDKSRDDYEYERCKDECTFVPNLNRYGGSSQSTQSTFLNAKKHSLQTSKSVNNLKGSEKTIKRMHQARNEKAKLNHLLQTGKHWNERGAMSGRNSKSPYRSQTRKEQSSNLQSTSSMNNERRKTGSFSQSFAQPSTSRSKDVSSYNKAKTKSRQGPKITYYPQRVFRTNNFEKKKLSQKQSQFPSASNEGNKGNVSVDDQSKENGVRQPLLYVDVNLGPDSSERIVVYTGDTAQQLAQQFSIKHQLDQDTKEKLQSLLEQQIAGIVLKYQEELH